jgi:hypothetical protein
MFASFNRLRDDQAVSPGTKSFEGSNYFDGPSNSPSRQRGPLTAPFQNYRQELQAADSPSIPAIHHQPPSAPLAQIAPWADPSSVPATAGLPQPHSFFIHSDDYESIHRPGTARTDTSSSYDVSWQDEDRQTSIASSGTAVSRESNEKLGARAKARKIVDKLTGDDGRGSQPYSNRTPAISTNSLRPRASTTLPRERARPASPSSLRPRTPQAQPPPSEVAPWIFQDYKASFFWFPCFKKPNSLFLKLSLL